MSEFENQADQAVAAGRYAEARSLLAQAVAAQPGSFDAHVKLAAMCRATGDDASALRAVDGALGLRALDPSALLMRAALLEALGRVDEAARAYGRALAQAPQNSLPAMAAAYQNAEARYSGWQKREASRLMQVASNLGPVSQDVERFITNAVRLTQPDREGPTHYCFPGLPEQPFHSRDAFPWLEALEAEVETIQAECEQALAEHASELVPYIRYPNSVPLEQWRQLNNNKDWTAIHLIDRGQPVAANANQCPKTMDLLRHLPQPDIEGAGPNAMFSLLAPGTHIPPHTGIANVRLVCHLPLIVPEGCWFRVGEETRNWERGTAWLFDDTVEHEAMNPSNALRIILICDVWHPDLSLEDRRAISAIIGAGEGIHGL